MRLPPHWQRFRHPLAAALCTLTTLVALPLREILNVANIDMLFLLTVFLIAIWLGRGPSVLAAFLSVALFDFFFIPPYLSFAVADAQYLITFGVMLAVGLITSHLVVRLSEQTEQAKAKERDTRILYDLAKDLAVALEEKSVADCISRCLGQLGLTPTLLLVSGEDPEIRFTLIDGPELGSLELSFARSACKRRTTVEADSLADMGVAVMFLPLNVPQDSRGVLAITPSGGDVHVLREQRPLLEAIASLVAMVIERLHYAQSAQRSELEVVSERLRSTILSSLSHDLRTPLTSLVGLADSLVELDPPLGKDTREVASSIRDQAHAMHHLLSNLLDMARLKSGYISLNKAWQPIEEIIGSSTRLLTPLLADRQLVIDAPAGLPLINFDSVLLERVVCNLLENAVKYSDTGAAITVKLALQDGELVVSVCNAGKGFPPDRLKQVFELFVRGGNETAVPGTGMGLAICEAIVTAHGGTIAAENHAGGACVRFSLPLGNPPTFVEECAA
jgi:two-component system sensor histidine kinase KdpD